MSLLSLVCPFHVRRTSPPRNAHESAGEGHEPSGKILHSLKSLLMRFVGYPKNISDLPSQYKHILLGGTQGEARSVLVLKSDCYAVEDVFSSSSSPFHRTCGGSVDLIPIEFTISSSFQAKWLKTNLRMIFLRQQSKTTRRMWHLPSRRWCLFQEGVSLTRWNLIL